MKKNIITICLVLFLAFLPVVAMATRSESIPVEEITAEDASVYYLSAEVYGINQNGVILLLAEDGNLWEVEDLDLREGDELVLLMHDNNTVVRRTDDVIIKVFVAQG